MNIVTLYEWFVGNMEDGQWSLYDMPAGGQHSNKKANEVLETAFWDAFWANVSPNMKKEHCKEALSVALGVGIVNRYFVDGGILDDVDLKDDRGHDRSLNYAKGILLHLRDSGV